MMTRELLTDRARGLVEAVRRASQNGARWAKRADIADELGKKQLDAGDNALLDLLEVQGYVEQQAVETNAPSGLRYEYRVKAED